MQQVHRGEPPVLLPPTTGKDDRWVRKLLSEFDGLSPQALAAQVLQESGIRSGAGDAGRITPAATPAGRDSPHSRSTTPPRRR